VEGEQMTDAEVVDELQALRRDADRMSARLDDIYRSSCRDTSRQFPPVRVVEPG